MSFFYIITRNFNASWRYIRMAYAVIFVLSMFFGYQSYAQEPLMITEVNVVIQENNAVLTWDTNFPSKGKVDYGKTESYGYYVEEGGSNRISHTITLYNLEQNTKYHFRVTSKTSLEEVSTFDRTFTTKKATDNITPIISNVTVYFLTGKTATIQWTTDEAADSQIFYGKTESYGSKKSSSTKTFSHDLTLTNLTPATVYHFQVKSQDDDRNLATYYDMTFRTYDTDLPDKQDLVIRDIRPVTINDAQISETSVMISWYTSRPSEGVVKYGPTVNLGKSLEAPKPRSFFHAVTLNGLTPGTLYYFQ